MRLANEQNIAGMVNGKENVTVPPDHWLQFLHGKKAGPLWIDYNKKTGNGAKAQHLLAEKEFFALEMAKIHIEQDLYYALLLEGAGADEEWKIIGEMVQEAGSEATGHWDATRQTGEFLGIIPKILEMRAKMHDRAKGTLKERYKINPDASPYGGAKEIEENYAPSPAPPPIIIPRQQR